MNTMTEKERRFAAEYATSCNGAASARAAGYSDVGGGARVMAVKLLKKPAIRALVDRLIAERAERVELDGDRIIQDLQRLARWSMLPVDVLDRHGRPTGVERPLDGPLACRCYELMGKSISLWTDRTETVTDQTIELVFPAAVAPTEDSFEDVGAVWRAEIEAVPHPRIGDGGTAFDADAPADETPGDETPEVIEKSCRNMRGIVIG